MKIYSISLIVPCLWFWRPGIFISAISTRCFQHRLYFVPVVLLVTLYIFMGSLIFWWMKRHTRPLIPKFWAGSKNTFLYHHRYTESEKENLKKVGPLCWSQVIPERRIKELRTVPFDIKNIISSQVVRLMLGAWWFFCWEIWIVSIFTNIRFPRPRKQYLHTVETDTEDGMLIFSTEQGLPGIVNPSMYYKHHTTRLCRSFSCFV